MNGENERGMEHQYAHMGWVDEYGDVVQLYAGSGDACCPVYNYTTTTTRTIKVYNKYYPC